MTTNTVPGISALQCVISSLRDTAHLSDEGGELTEQLRELRDWALSTAAQPPAAPQEELREDASYESMNLAVGAPSMSTDFQNPRASARGAVNDLLGGAAATHPPHPDWRLK